VEEIPPQLLRREGEAPMPSFTRPATGGGGRGGPAKRFDRNVESGGRTYHRDEFSDVSLDFEEVAGGPSHGVSVPARSAAARRAVGQRVNHERFGPGVVLAAEGEGPDMKLEVRFGGSIKKVLARFVSGGDEDA